ncbi:MAG: AAA family ATPase [Candidatus Dormibacteraeota bacterium]|nr:AAA family ATPase [Candidatus Dormibacteraeota bacterium]MBO0745618.1 AAA family ATPase [Candidatus Dormibacteraeota bacterium]
MHPHAPLFLLGGAAGAGKTSLIPHLARLARGVVVLDIDDLLEEGAVLGVPVATPTAAPVWPAYNRLWHRLTVAIRRSGIPVLLLATPPPKEGALEVWKSERDIHWALLDCAPQEQRRRLRTRGWSEAEIEGAVLDAEQARRAIQPAFRTDLDGPEQAARQVMDWVAQRTG